MKRSLPFRWASLMLVLIGLSFIVRVVFSAPAGNSTLYLPAIMSPGTADDTFQPTADTDLAGGVYNFSLLDIPAGVTVTALADTTINVSGNATVAGIIMADCFTVTLQAGGDVTITGKIDNRGSGDTDDCGDLTISSNQGNLEIGTAELAAELQSSGDLNVTNDPSLAAWEFEVLPDQRSDTPLPPVCSAQADTVLGTAVAGSPVEVRFSGSAADPDGGLVTYAWDFGDSGSSTEQEPLHSYTAWGVYPVTLTASDNDGQDCQATLQVVIDDGETNIPAAPAVWAGPVDVAVAAGSPAAFAADSLASVAGGDGELTYAWDFGDGGNSAEDQPTHTYSLPGRYLVSLTVTEAVTATFTAESSIYVYEPAAELPIANTPEMGGNCLVAGASVFNIVYNGGVAGAGKDGRNAKFTGRGNVFLGAATDIKAQDGGDGVDRVGVGTVSGGRGGRGGSLSILIDGRLTVCAGAYLANGNGGTGGDATATAPAAGTARAIAGQGGEAGRRLWLAASTSLTFAAPAGGMIGLNPGDGGDGGVADARGDDGADACPIGQDGAAAQATGGNGGHASKVAIIVGAPAGVGNVLVVGGWGGDGGAATAVGGFGGDASCPGTATGGAGRSAKARGGQGGNARLSGAAAAFSIAPLAFMAGDGGNAEATGGWGGTATATPPGPCAPATATGGIGGYGEAVGGKGGRGLTDGDGGDGDALGGGGGVASATGGDCLACGDGGAGTATAGRGGHAEGRKGKAGGATGMDGTGIAQGGNGGHSDANGGRGGDCPICPAGKGGDGGAATGKGGNGGNASGNDSKTGGNGGRGDAQGGRGGDGADCCNMIPKLPGGNGGKGGSATSVAGTAGLPGGTVGDNLTKGGNGGDGGDGKPNGTGGAGGTGIGTPNDIPDGTPGIAGIFCFESWFINFCGMPDGPVPPGTTISLPTYAEDMTTITGSVPAHFLTQEEFGGPVNYLKNGQSLMVQSGGIRYDLSGIVEAFPVIQVNAQMDHNCGGTGCVNLTGFYQGNPVGGVANQLPSGHETLSLPMVGGTVPFYDSFLWAGTSYMFNCWWLVIVDP